MSRRERLAWTLLVAAALGLRLWDLGARPPHHDEAVHAHFADAVLSRGEYRYDPTYHGPLLFYVTAAVFAIAGQSLTTARLYPAIAGCLLVALPLLLRRRIGRSAAWWSGLALALSPTFVYYSRFARNDVPVSLFTAWALVLLLSVRRRGWRALPWVGVAAALHAISKETFYVALPLLAFAGAATVVTGGPRERLRRLVAFVVRHRVPLATACAWFFVITATAYTFFFVHPEDVAFPLRAVRYWWEQHRVERVGGPWFYHLPRLALYEFLLLGAALAWLARRHRRLRGLEVFCLCWGLASVAAYAYLGEKTPWLLTHQLLPFVPLAGLQLARTFSPAGRAWSRALAAVALAATAWSTLASSFLHPTITPADPHAELLVFVQTTPEAGALAAHGAELAATVNERPFAAVAGEAAWPLWWQWRRYDVWWALPGEGMRPPLVVCDPKDEAAVSSALGPAYAARRLPLRAWWVEEWAGVRPVAVLRWVATRRAWSPLGSTDIVAFERSP